MASFDYNINPVIGTLSINDSSGHGYVTVLGYMDGGSFIKLSSKEAEEIFQPNGEVFAHLIQRDYYGFHRALVSMFVKLNVNEKGKNKFIWDKSETVDLAGSVIEKLDDVFSEDGGHNFDILSSKDLIGKDVDVFVQSGNKLCFIKSGSDSRLIPFCRYDDSLPIIDWNSKSYYIGSKLPRIDGQIDLTSDEQLVDWYLRTIKSDWEDIQKGSGKVSLRAAKDALMAMKNLPSSIAESRFARLQALTETFVISRDNLKIISASPWLKPTVEAAIEQFKDDYIDTVIAENKQELEQLRESHKKALNEETIKHNQEVVALHESTQKIKEQCDEKIESLKSQIAQTQAELDTVQSTLEGKQLALSEMQQNLETISERKDSIIQDFQVVKDVLGISGEPTFSQKDQSTITITELSISEKRLPYYKGYENNLEKCLNLYNVAVPSITELANQHAANRVLLLPNMEIAMSMVAAAGKSFYHISYASVAWKSFNDLWASGLEQMVAHCGKHSEVIHYFILRNINLSCLSNYLQPLADLQEGYLTTFPGSDIQFPDNLRILLTASDEELIPMTAGILRSFGCVTKEIKKSPHGPVSFTDDACIGFIDTELLSINAGQIKDVPNYFEEYIDE
jgi:hypothetical protein